MKIGKLKHRITIQTKVRSGQDQVTGKILYDWVTYSTIWAEVTDLSTKDQLAAKAAQSTIQARAKIRYSQKSKLITSDMRVSFDGYFYRIDGNPMADPDSRREYLTLNLATGDSGWNP